MIFLQVNIWFLLCLFFCRSRLDCCATGADCSSGSGGSGAASNAPVVASSDSAEAAARRKGFSASSTCETELAGLMKTDDAMQRQLEESYRQQSRHHADGGGGVAYTNSSGNMGQPTEVLFHAC